MVTSLRLKSELSKKADFVIRPNTMGLHWSDFDHFDALVQFGREATLERIPELKQQLKSKDSIFYKLKQWMN